MTRPNPFLLTILLLVFIGIFGGMPFLKGGLFPDTHEGDIYHALDIIFRIVDGEVPHIDFVTPLGVFAFWPIAKIIEQGQSVGFAFFYAQLGAALLLLPFVVYAATTRMPRGVALFFGLITMLFVLAVSYGAPSSGVAVSMHYNRWCWAISFTMLALALLPPREGRNRPVFEGILIGFLCGLLLFLKITYFVALMPMAAIALARLYGMRSLLAAFVAGCGVIASVAVLFGPALLPAYLGDLTLIAGNSVRPYVGVPLNEIIAGPVYLPATLVGLAALYVLRTAFSPATGLLMLGLIAGFIFVTYQNFGTQPFWLIFLAVVLLSLRPLVGDEEILGVKSKNAFLGLALIGLTIVFPGLYNMALSPLKNLTMDDGRFMAFLPEKAGQQDLYLRTDRGYTTTLQIHADTLAERWVHFAEKLEKKEDLSLEGVSFPYCEWVAGTRAYMDAHVQALADGPMPDNARLFVGDVLSAFWLYGDIARISGAAPWYYGNLTGIENADYVVIPKCSLVSSAQSVLIKELIEADLPLQLLEDSDLHALYAINR